MALDNVRFVVLDEIDTMLDKGFKFAIDKIMKHSDMVAAGTRQTLMFSATFPEAIQRLAGEYLNNYAFVGTKKLGKKGGQFGDYDLESQGAVNNAASGRGHTLLFFSCFVVVVFFIFVYFLLVKLGVRFFGGMHTGGAL